MTSLIQHVIDRLEQAESELRERGHRNDCPAVFAETASAGCLCDEVENQRLADVLRDTIAQLRAIG